MRAVVQRVSRARVTVDERTVAAIDAGLLVLLGVARDDTEADALWIASKIAGLRVFEDTDARMNLSVQDVGGAALVVSQFTLLGSCRKGRRPSFVDAASPQDASPLVDRVAAALADAGVAAPQGKFGAHMHVELVNDGPVTLVIDSPRLGR
jgi:D-aminoacyl-tRNA deacylase